MILIKLETADKTFAALSEKPIILQFRGSLNSTVCPRAPLQLFFSFPFLLKFCFTAASVPELTVLCHCLSTPFVHRRSALQNPTSQRASAETTSSCEFSPFLCLFPNKESSLILKILLCIYLPSPMDEPDVYSAVLCQVSSVVPVSL